MWLKDLYPSSSVFHQLEEGKIQKTAFFFNKFRWKTELQVCHLPTAGRMTWNMKLSNTGQGWSRSDKSNILSSTILTPSSPTPSARVTSHVFMQHCTINSRISPIKWSLAPNVVVWQMPWSWELLLKGELLGYTSPLWATTSFDVVRSLCSPLFSQAVVLWVLEGTMLERSVLLSKSNRAKVVDAVLHQVVALRSLCKSIPHSFAGFTPGLETQPFWVSESWQRFQAPALLLAECWAVLQLSCCTVSFRLWNPGSVETVLLQLHGMLLLSPTICQFLWLRRYKACVPARQCQRWKFSRSVCCVQIKCFLPSMEEIF